MKSLGAAKHFILAFVIALVGYAVFYKAIENRRVKNGPWHVLFTNSPAGAPMIVINQPKLAIRDIEVMFLDVSLPENAALGELVFDQPKAIPFKVPFGQCVFMDTTVLPGTVTFRLFGHEVQLLPRVLTINKQEHPWLPGHPLRLHAREQAPPSPPPSRAEESPTDPL